MTCQTCSRASLGRLRRQTRFCCRPSGWRCIDSGRKLKYSSYLFLRSSTKLVDILSQCRSAGRFESSDDRGDDFRVREAFSDEKFFCVDVLGQDNHTDFSRWLQQLHRLISSLLRRWMWRVLGVAMGFELGIPYHGSREGILLLVANQKTSSSRRRISSTSLESRTNSQCSFGSSRQRSNSPLSSLSLS